MTQTPGSMPEPLAPDYDRTLVLAVELSNVSWVRAAQVPGLPRVKAKRVVEPVPRRCWPPSGAIATGQGGRAGLERVWLARWLDVRGVEVHVIQPSSVPVDRQAWRFVTPHFSLYDVTLWGGLHLILTDR